MTQTSSQLIDQLYIDKVLAARARTMEQKFLATGELYQAVLERFRSGILMQNPHASEEQISQEIRRRFEIARLLENRT